MMMGSPQPMIVIGGTDATVSLLPCLGWKRLPQCLEPKNATPPGRSGVVLEENSTAPLGRSWGESLCR
jgi:hypothetical protein